MGEPYPSDLFDIVQGLYMAGKDKTFILSSLLADSALADSLGEPITKEMLESAFDDAVRLTPQFIDTYGRRPGNLEDAARHVRQVVEQRERERTKRNSPVRGLPQYSEGLLPSVPNGTRGDVMVWDGIGDHWTRLFSYSDGNPAGVFPILEQLFGYIDDGLIRNDPMIVAGWLVVLSRREMIEYLGRNSDRPAAGSLGLKEKYTDSYLALMGDPLSPVDDSAAMDYGWRPAFLFPVPLLPGVWNEYTYWVSVQDQLVKVGHPEPTSGEMFRFDAETKKLVSAPEARTPGWTIPAKPNPMGAAEFPETDSESLRYGMMAELDAINLYEQMANETKDPKLKAVFLDVAKEEKTHVGEFQALLGEKDAQHNLELVRGASEVAGMKVGNPLDFDADADLRAIFCSVCGKKMTDVHDRSLGYHYFHVEEAQGAKA